MDAGRPFPGFDLIYEVEDPLLDRAYRGTFENAMPFATVASLVRGEWRPDAPLVVRHHMGGTVPGDVVWTDDGALIVAQRVVDILAENAFTGWTTYPVELQDRRGRPVPGYHGLAITGRCGRVSVDLTTLVELDQDPGTLAYRGRTFDPATWDGSDIFIFNFTPLYVVPAVKSALEQAAVDNLEITPLTEVLTPKLVVDLRDA